MWLTIAMGLVVGSLPGFPTDLTGAWDSPDGTTIILGHRQVALSSGGEALGPLEFHLSSTFDNEYVTEMNLGTPLPLKVKFVRDKNPDRLISYGIKDGKVTRTVLKRPKEPPSTASWAERATWMLDRKLRDADYRRTLSKGAAPVLGKTADLLLMDWLVMRNAQRVVLVATFAQMGEVKLAWEFNRQGHIRAEVGRKKHARATEWLKTEVLPGIVDALGE